MRERQRQRRCAVVAEFGRPEEESPYGCEFELCDADGNRLRITKCPS